MRRQIMRPRRLRGVGVIIALTGDAQRLRIDKSSKSRTPKRRAFSIGIITE